MISTQALARACAGHPKRTIGIWIGLVVVALVVVASLLSGRLTSDGAPTNNPDSKKAKSLIADEFPGYANHEATDIVIARSTRYSAQAPQFRDYVAGLVRQIRATGVATNVQSYLASPNSSLVSRDGHATMLPIDVPTKGDITHVLSVLHKEKANPAFALDITGTDTLNHDFSQLGRWNWYLPRRLAWLPEVHIEGSPAQRHARAS